MKQRRASFLFRISTFLTVGVALVAATLSGCATLPKTLRYNAADSRFALDKPSGPSLGSNAAQILHENGLQAPKNVDDLERLRTLLETDTTPDLVYLYAETAYLYARRVEKSRPNQALRIYADVVRCAWSYLFNPALSDERERARWNGQLSDVVLLYNGASERFLHLVLLDALKKSDAEFPFQLNGTTTIPMESDAVRVEYRVEPGAWRSDEYGDFYVASDCAVGSFNFSSRQSGFGVPLVVERRAGGRSSRVEEKYYPQSILFPATAILRPNPSQTLGTLPPLDPNASAASDAPDFTLDVFDPMTTSDFVQNGAAFPLETDLTTPLAYFLSTNGKLFRRAAWTGLVRPDKLQESEEVAVVREERQLQGLYLFEPYDPKKIPVIMTHGLGSSPITWMEMYNALRSIKGFQSGYQFMFFFYPTGQPFWASAATFRKELVDFRDTVDPDRLAPALDATVLIGHSMGGLVSRMQVQESGDLIWSLVSSRPVDSFDFDPDARKRIHDWFFFEPNPSVKRVITIATPFRGSKFANTFTQWLAFNAISSPQSVVSVFSSAASVAFSSKKREKDADFDSKLLMISTSVQSLDPECPIFKVLDELPIPEDVALDNIVGVEPHIKNRKIQPMKSDGVVNFQSAHRDDVESETETPAFHTAVHMHFDAINQVKNLLATHLALYAGGANVDNRVVKSRNWSPRGESSKAAGPVAPSADFYRRDAASPLDVPVESDGPTLPSTFYAPVESATESATVRGVRASRFFEPRSPVR